MHKGMCWGHKIAMVLLFIGGLNWGLVGLGGFTGADWNLVHMILGSWPMLEWIVYILVGISALMMLGYKKCCGMGMCGKCGGDCSGKCEGGKCMGGKCNGMKEGMKCQGQGMKCSGGMKN